MVLKKGITVDLFIDEDNYDEISKTIFTFNKNGITKVYPEDVSYSDGKYLVKLSQEDTNSFILGENKLECQYIYKNGSVNKSEIYKFIVVDTLATEMVE